MAKQFIHLYFNSKYARDGYTINGDNYSLKQDISDEGREDYDVVKKYIRAINIDNSGGEVNNVKHLYGATLLLLRALPENGALHLLRTFCLLFLGIGKNETLRKEAHDSYIEGFMALYERGVENIFSLIDDFNSILYRVKRDNFKDIIENGKDEILLLIHGKWFDGFRGGYGGGIDTDDDNPPEEDSNDDNNNDNPPKEDSNDDNKNDNPPEEPNDGHK